MYVYKYFYISLCHFLIKAVLPYGAPFGMFLFWFLLEGTNKYLKNQTFWFKLVIFTNLSVETGGFQMDCCLFFQQTMAHRSE